MMEKKMATIGNKGLYRIYIGIIRDMLRLYWDNGKENGNYCNIIGFLYGGYIGISFRPRNLQLVQSP